MRASGSVGTIQAIIQVIRVIRGMLGPAGGEDDGTGVLPWGGAMGVNDGPWEGSLREKEAIAVPARWAGIQMREAISMQSERH